jgi:hypothetical protein
MAEQRQRQQKRKPKSVVSIKRVPTAVHFEKSAPGVGGRAIQTNGPEHSGHSPMFVIKEQGPLNILRRL